MQKKKNKGKAAVSHLIPDANQQSVSTHILHTFAEHATAIDKLPRFEPLHLLLVKRGCDCNAIDHKGRTALYFLAESVKDVNFKTSVLARALLPGTDINKTADNGVSLLTLLLGRLGQPGDDIPTHVKDSVMELLKHDVDTNTANPTNGETPLHVAARFRSVEFLELFLQRGANVNTKDLCGQTPLMKAVLSAPTDASANFDAEDVLLQAGADINVQDTSGRCVLHYAFIKTPPLVDKKTLKVTEPVWVTDKGSFTAAAWEQLGSGKPIDPVETVSSLCAKRRDVTDVNLADANGLTPLHCACLRGSSVSAVKLLNCGAQTTATFCNNGILGLALQNNPDMAILLMQRKIDIGAPCTFIGRPGVRGPAVLQKEESLFSLAIRQVCHYESVSKSQATAAYLGAAYTVLDLGYNFASAINDTIASNQLKMLLALLPKTSDTLLQSKEFEGGQCLLHRLASIAPQTAKKKDASKFAVGDYVIWDQYGVSGSGTVSQASMWSSYLQVTNEATGRSESVYASSAKKAEVQQNNASTQIRPARVLSPTILSLVLVSTLIHLDLATKFLFGSSLDSLFAVVLPPPPDSQC